MRTIKFRGKEIGTNQWVYGDLLQCPNKYPTIRMWEEAYPISRSIDFVVFPETIGQFTGLHDKNGKEIYEGDILDVDFLNHKTEVQYILDGFVAGRKNYPSESLNAVYKDCRVIGNIHDNPELLKGGEQ